MSLAFHRAFIPPPVISDWRGWIRETNLTAEQIRTLSWVISLLNRRIRWLPRDVWNCIVARMHPVELYHEPERWNQCLNRWLQYWVTHPDQQEANRLNIASLGKCAINSQVAAISVLVHQDSNNGAPKKTGTPPDAVVGYESRTMTGALILSKMPDVILGITVDDPEILPYLRYHFHAGGITTDPFSSQYQAKIWSSVDQKWVWFYYHPDLPCLPIRALPYTDISLIKFPASQAVQVGFVYVYVQPDPSRDELEQSMHVYEKYIIHASWSLVLFHLFCVYIIAIEVQLPFQVGQQPPRAIQTLGGLRRLQLENGPFHQRNVLTNAVDLNGTVHSIIAGVHPVQNKRHFHFTWPFSLNKFDKLIS